MFPLVPSYCKIEIFAEVDLWVQLGGKVLIVFLFIDTKMIVEIYV